MFIGQIFMRWLKNSLNVQSRKNSVWYLVYKVFRSTYFFMALLASSSCPKPVRATKCFLYDSYHNILNIIIVIYVRKIFKVRVKWSRMRRRKSRVWDVETSNVEIILRTCDVQRFISYCTLFCNVVFVKKLIPFLFRK
jgi:hypothetical protein